MRARLAALVTVLAVAVAAPVTAEPSPRALELARRYAQAIHFDRQLATIMDNLVPAMVEQRLLQKGQTLSGEVKVAIGRASADTGRAIAPKMLDLMIPVIAEIYTEAELQAAVAYYESAAGQSLLSKTPELTARLTPALTALGPEIDADFEARFCREVACDEK